jgi:RNase adaptor protein for sRNA GlmZ degradation
LQDVLGGADWDRRRLQREGADLDRRTRGTWLMRYLETRSDLTERLIVDAVRTRRQAEPILNAALGARLIFLGASEDTRRRRYTLAQRTDPLKRPTGFDEAMAHPTETQAAELRSMAHFVIETDDLDVDGVAAELCAYLLW